MKFIILTAKHQIFGSSSSHDAVAETTTGQRSKFQALNRIPPTERSYNVIIVQIHTMLLDQIIAWRSIGEREYSTMYCRCNPAKNSCSPVTFIKQVPSTEIPIYSICTYLQKQARHFSTNDDQKMYILGHFFYLCIYVHGTRTQLSMARALVRI